MTISNRVDNFISDGCQDHDAADPNITNDSRVTVEVEINSPTINDIGDLTFTPEYTDSITSTNSEKPLLKDVPEHKYKIQKVLDKNTFIDSSLWDLNEEDESQECRSIVGGLLEKPAFVKAISCESLRSSVISQACRSALKLSLDKANNSLDSLSKVHIQEVTGQESVGKKIRKNLVFMKDVILLSVGTMIAYSAFLSIRNLQSSLNTTGGLGLFSLALGYSMYMPGAILAPFIVKVLLPKRSLVAALFCQCTYIVSNFYPSFYTLLPSCLLIGFGNAVFWVSISSYLVFSANKCAAETKKILEFVLSRFYGVFFLIYQLNNLPGNILSSVILSYGVPLETFSSSGSFMINSSVDNRSFVNRTAPVYESSFDTNKTLYSSNMGDSDDICGASFVYVLTSNATSTAKVSEQLRFILVGALTLVDLAGILIIVFFVKPVKIVKAKFQIKVVKQEAKKTLNMFRDRKYLLLCPLLLYSGWQTAFMNGDMIKAFITCTLGIQMVGYLVMGFGLTTSLSSYLSGILNKRIGRKVQILAGFVINIGLMVFMLIWPPRMADGLVPFILLFCLWGVSDGIWNSQMNGIIGVVFEDKAESANACFRLLQGLGVSMAYAYAQVLIMSTKIYITGAVATVGIIGYLVMELMVKPKEKTALTV